MAKKKDIHSLCNKAAIEAIENLLAICNSSEEKTSDRIAAAKVLIDYGMEKQETDDSGVLTVMFDGIPKEYCK